MNRTTEEAVKAGLISIGEEKGIEKIVKNMLKENSF